MKKLIRFVGNTSIAGLLAILPLFLTVRAVAWLIGFLDSSFGTWVKVATGHEFPGAGTAAAFGLILGIGTIVRTVGADRFLEFLDGLVLKIPGIGRVYATIRQLLDPLSHPESRPFRDAVWVELGNGMRVLGFVTSSPFQERPEEGKRVNVYLPMSHPYVGYVVTLDPEKLRPATAAFDEVVSYHFSCGSALPRGYRDGAAMKSAPAGIPGVRGGMIAPIPSE
jgi:uncharacterized membrane protein